MPSALAIGLVSTVAAAVTIGGVGLTVAAATEDTDDATVVKVVDGDTLDVRYEGATHRVRLLNIDTPELGGAKGDDECLAQEASDYLKDRLPAGSAVDLEWDDDHTDPYGRQLRGVFDDRGFVNTDIVRKGFAVPMHIAPNDRYRAEVDEAFADASRTGRGLFDHEQGCTLPARTTRVNDAVDDGDRAAARKEALALRALLKDPDSVTSRLMTSTERTLALGRLDKVIDGHAPRPKKTTASPTKAPSPTPSSSRAPAPKPSTSTPAPKPSTSTPPPAPAPKPSTSTPPPAPAPKPSTSTPPPAPTTRSAPPAPAPRSTSTAPPPAAPAPRPNNAAPCRSYAPGGKSFTYIDCDTRQPL